MTENFPSLSKHEILERKAHQNWASETKKKKKKKKK